MSDLVITQEPMTAEDATTFESYSEFNAQTLMDAAEARGCECQPYVDWFTYKRWKAQGMQVQKGEHGVKITTFVERFSKTEKDKNGRPKSYRVPRNTSVFCRCQVKESDGEYPRPDDVSPKFTGKKTKASTVSYDDWMSKLDGICQAKYGCSIHDLSDCNFKDWYEDGMKPYDAVVKAKQNDE